MSSQLLETLIKESSSLTANEKLRLAAHLLEQASQENIKTTPRRKWKEILGIVSYPLVGEDAQVWVSRTRREADEHRERRLRPKP